MAVAIQGDYQSAAFSYSSPNLTGTITKPTNLAVGNILLLVIGGGSTSNNVSASTPSGWTAIQTPNGFDFSPNTGGFCFAYYKIADSSDVAASNFSFSFSVGGGASASGRGFLMRITGHNPVTPISISAAGGGYYTSSSGATFSSSGITPTYANSLLILCGVNTSNSGGLSGYSIATDNPSWTELIEEASSSRHVAVAYALRPQVSATGNFGWSVSGVNANSWAFGIILAINSPLAVTVTVPILQLTLSIPTPVIKIGVKIIAPIMGMTLSLIAPIIKLITAWTNDSKSSTSWDNDEKS